MTKSLAMLLTLIGLSLPSCAKSHPVPDVQAACTVATARITALRHLPISHVAYCEGSQSADNLQAYYIVGLHGRCLEEVCGSTLMGWFAVRKSDGNVFEYNVGESKVGRSVTEES
jgi:hypothetical protein